MLSFRAGTTLNLKINPVGGDIDLKDSTPQCTVNDPSLATVGTFDPASLKFPVTLGPGLGVATFRTFAVDADQDAGETRFLADVETEIEVVASVAEASSATVDVTDVVTPAE